MGSVEAWRYTQRIAGLCWIAVGGGMTLLCVIAGVFMLMFNGGQAATLAMWAVGIELLLVVASWVFVNVMVLRKYDKDGNPRNTVEEISEEEYPEIEE